MTHWTKVELTYTAIFVVSVGLAAALPMPYSLIVDFGVVVVLDFCYRNT